MHTYTLAHTKIYTSLYGGVLGRGVLCQEVLPLLVQLTRQVVVLQLDGCKTEEKLYIIHNKVNMY